MSIINGMKSISRYLFKNVLNKLQISFFLKSQPKVEILAIFSKNKFFYILKFLLILSSLSKTHLKYVEENIGAFLGGSIWNVAWSGQGVMKDFSAPLTHTFWSLAKNTLVYFYTCSPPCL